MRETNAKKYCGMVISRDLMLFGIFIVFPVGLSYQVYTDKKNTYHWQMYLDNLIIIFTGKI